MAFVWAEITVPTSAGADVLDFIWDSGHGRLVGVGTDGLVYTTPDLVTVTKQTAASASRWNGIAYAPTIGAAGRLVAVGTSPGAVMTSDDGGTTWTSRTPSIGTARGVVWADALSLFVAVGDGGAADGSESVMTSADGITWTTRAGTNPRRPWQGVTWSSSLGVLVAAANSSSGIVMTSPNGTTWTARTTPANITADAPVSGSNFVPWDPFSGLFAIMGFSSITGNKVLMTSPDGVTWTTQTIPNPTDAHGGCIGFDGVGLVLFRRSAGTDLVDTSGNGSTWATESAGVDRFLGAAGKIESLGKIVAWCGVDIKMLVGTASAPTRVTPAQGRTTGGRLVRITGSGFTGTPVVTFGGVAATSITVVSPTRITARTPAHAAGPVDVVVGSVTLEDGFLYTDTLFGDLRIRRPQGILVDDTLNDAPNSATLRCERVGTPPAPALGASVQLVDPASGALLFGGTALVVTDGIDGRASNPGYRDLKAGDLAWRFNAVRPFGTWTTRPANVVAQELIDRFAPAFTGVIATGLPTISLTCNRSQTMSEVFSAIAALIGGSWYPDDAFGIHLFLTNPADPPDPITDATPLYDPPPTVTRDLSQVRNRIFVKGAGPGDAFQAAVHPPTIGDMEIAATTGGAIPNGFYYEYSMTSVTADGESVAESSGFGGASILEPFPGTDNAFALSNLDETVSPDPRVVGRKLYRNRSVEDPTVPPTTNCVTRQYLITTLGNTAGIGEDTFFDGKADAELTQLAPNVDTTASIFVQVEDTAAQAYLAALLNVDGGDDDGIRDGYVSDANLTTLEMATARAEAELALWAYPVETVTVAARDEKLVSGQSVAITLTNPAIAGTFKIQHVRIDQVAIDATGMLFPRRTITASSVRYTLDDLLRDVLLSGGGTGGSSGAGSSSGSGGSGGGAPAPAVPDAITGEIPAGAINGTNVVFTTAADYAGLRVFKNGQRLTLGDDYTETGADEFTLAAAPVAPDVILVDYGDTAGGGGGTAFTTGDGLVLAASVLDLVLDGASLTKSPTGLKVTGGASAGALVLLASLTASASASLAFTTRTAGGAIFQSDYDEYVIEVVNCVPGTDGVNLQWQVSTDGGATYVTSTAYRYAQRYTGSAAATGISNSNSTTFVQFAGLLSNVAAGGGACATLRVFDPLSATHEKILRHASAFKSNDGNYYYIDGMGAYAATTAVTALRFLMTTGTIASGAIRVYGVAK